MWQYRPQKTEPATIVEKARSLSQRNILRPQFVGEPLVDQVRREPHATDSSIGALQTAHFDGCGKLLMTGTARVPHLKRKPDCIVVGYVTEDHRLTPFAVFRPEFERREPKERFRVYDYPQDGFAVAVDASNLPKSALVLRGWGVDMAQQKAFPLTESINIREGSDGSF